MKQQRMHVHLLEERKCIEKNSNKIQIFIWLELELQCIEGKRVS